MFAYFCRDVVSQYGIRNNSHTNTSLSNVYEHSSKDLIRMYFKLTNILFNVKTNVLGLNGVAFTNKALLFPCNACINMDGLLFVPILLDPYSVLYQIGNNSTMI